jgi:hypothetical protein
MTADQTPATCRWCEEPMDGRPCTAQTAVVEGVAYHRIPYGSLGWEHCNDCASPHGGLHHPGCDLEQCPRCLGQAISCGCRWASDAPDPGLDEFLLAAESPKARRA